MIYIDNLRNSMIQSEEIVLMLTLSRNNDFWWGPVVFCLFACGPQLCEEG